MGASIKPEDFDYPGAVAQADENGFDWGGLFKATQDPGFGQLDQGQQQHIMNLLQTKIGLAAGAGQYSREGVSPYARTGEVGGLRQAGEVVKGIGKFALTVLDPATAIHAFDPVAERQGQAAAEYVSMGMGQEAAARQARDDLINAGNKITQQFFHYLTGGVVDAPKESKNPFVTNIMENRVKPVTQLAAVGTQVAVGGYALGLVSKVPLVSGATANLSALTRGLIKGAILDFGITAAMPDGLPQEERFGISDDIGRFIAPATVKADPSGLGGRLAYGVGGAVEGGLLGYALYGIGSGIKLADSKYAFSLSARQVERMKQSLELAGVDVAGMTKRDLWLTYRGRMSEHVQGIDEAVFNGERLSAESWIAQAFLADPNITQLTPQEGRFLWGVFSTNKGGVSIIRGVEDPTAAIAKLKQVGIDVDATVIPRTPAAEAAVSAIPAPSGAPATSASRTPARSGAARRGARRPTAARVREAEERAAAAERRLADVEREAQTDPLTGLHNAKSWSAMEARVNADPNLEVVAIDLGNFKAVNDIEGHGPGDKVLQKVAEDLHTAVATIKGETQVIRKGGDEFVLVVPRGEGQPALDRAKVLFGQRKVGDTELHVHVRGGVGPTFGEADAAERAAKATNGEKAYVRPGAEPPKPTEPVPGTPDVQVTVEPDPLERQLAVLKQKVAAEGVPPRSANVTVLSHDDLIDMQMKRYVKIIDGEPVKYNPREVFTEVQRRYALYRTEAEQLDFVLEGVEWGPKMDKEMVQPWNARDNARRRMREMEGVLQRMASYMDSDMRFYGPKPGGPQ